MLLFDCENMRHVNVVHIHTCSVLCCFLDPSSEELRSLSDANLHHSGIFPKLEQKDHDNSQVLLVFKREIHAGLFELNTSKELKSSTKAPKKVEFCDLNKLCKIQLFCIIYC